jgi:hypothetical protein
LLPAYLYLSHPSICSFKQWKSVLPWKPLKTVSPQNTQHRKCYEHFLLFQEIDVEVELTANHWGRFEMFLCPNNNPRYEATQTCFDRLVFVTSRTALMSFNILLIYSSRTLEYGKCNSPGDLLEEKFALTYFFVCHEKLTLIYKWEWFICTRVLKSLSVS